MPEDSESNSYERIEKYTDRFWQAETVNAERYAARVRVLVPLATALAGFLFLGLVTSVSRVRSDIDWPYLVLPTAMGVTALWFVWTTLANLFRSSDEFEPISELLQQQIGDENRANALNDDDSRNASWYFKLEDEEQIEKVFGQIASDELIIFVQNIYFAALDLQERNLRVREKIRNAEHQLKYAVLYTLLTAAFFMVSVIGGPALVAAIATDSEDRNEQASNIKTEITGSREGFQELGTQPEK